MIAHSLRNVLKEKVTVMGILNFSRYCAKLDELMRDNVTQSIMVRTSCDSYSRDISSDSNQKGPKIASDRMTYVELMAGSRSQLLFYYATSKMNHIQASIKRSIPAKMSRSRRIVPHSSLPRLSQLLLSIL